jgi:peroxiredoxin family protein
VAYEIGVELVDCATTSEVIGIFVEKNSFRSVIDILSGATYFFLNLACKSKVTLLV